MEAEAWRDSYKNAPSLQGNQAKRTILIEAK